MTPDEIQMFFDAMVEKNKEELSLDYNLAVMIASFVNSAIGGHKIPSIFEVFPNTFSEEERETFKLRQEEETIRKWVISTNARMKKEVKDGT